MSGNNFTSFENREHMEEAVLTICRPMLTRVRPSGAQVRLGSAAAIFSSNSQGMEGFCRLLWGVAPLLAHGRTFAGEEMLRRGIAAGTDEKHPEFWGWPADYDQRLVELAAVAYALLLAPTAFWAPLSTRERATVAAFLGTINACKVRNNNWLFFRVLTNLALAVIDAPYSRDRIESDWGHIERFYLGNGWYSDGPGTQCDYYVAFAMHFYSLIYAQFAAAFDPVRVARIRDRAAEFAAQFAAWFSSDGSAIPYGRSLSYRCAQAAFWGALAYAAPNSYPIGVSKGILLRSLRWWFKQPICTDSGLLSVGYGYSNPSVGENYTSPCSPYWALKAFLPLALPSDDVFWNAAEEALPLQDGHYLQPAPCAILCRDGAHVWLMPGAPTVPSQHRNAPEKYAKFAYSSIFAFNLPASPRSLGACAHDSMLALSMDGDYFRVRSSSASVRAQDESLVFVWHPWPNVEVTTWLVAAVPWHVRVHRVRAQTCLFAAEGGYALRVADTEEGPETPPGWDGPRAAAASSEGLFSAILDRLDHRTGKVVFADVNTNILNRRTVIPTLTSEHPPGEFWLACAVAGRVGQPVLNPAAAPLVSIGMNTLRVFEASGRSIHESMLGTS